MSCTSNLFVDDHYMVTYCPACGQRIEVDMYDEHEELDDGTLEFYLECPNGDCLCRFYANEKY